MSEWIKKKVEEYKQKKEDIEYREKTINLANFWHILLEQIKKDIQAINQEEIWKDQVQNAVTFGDDYGGYVIKRPQYPYVALAIHNQGDKIEVRITCIAEQGAKEQNRTEVYQTIPQGRNIILRRDKEDYIVPEQASERILRPIVDSIVQSLGQY